MDSFGRIFRVSIFGESHGPAIGVVMDGVPEGIALCADDLRADIARRAPGEKGLLARQAACNAGACGNQPVLAEAKKPAGAGATGQEPPAGTGADRQECPGDGTDGTTARREADGTMARGEADGTTARREADEPEIVSGVYDGHTTGAPLTIIFRNADTRSADYADFDAMPRPGHADYTASVKWDWANDPRGGGHFSGRLTLPVVAAGAVAKKVLEGMDFKAELTELGGSADKAKWDDLIAQATAEGDSLGGIIDCTVTGVPIGLGEPFWDSVESLLSHAIFSIPGIRGIEFGDGFRAAAMRGSEHNDPFGPDGPTKNGAGGANGGLTNGAPLHFRVAVKPTSSISKPQRTWNFATQKQDTLRIKGRHDVCFAQRVPVIVEAMAAIVLADLV